MEEYYHPEFFQILHSQSPFQEVVNIKNTDIMIHGKPLIEYILSNIFTGNEIANKEEFDRVLAIETFRAEARYCIEYASRINAKNRFPLNTRIQFVDENPFLGGENNAYGKLLMEKYCNSIAYETDNSLIYDIYNAGETLKTLYINFPGEIGNPVYDTCKSYFDIIKLPMTHPFSEMCKERGCNTNIVDRTTFFRIYEDKQFGWIRAELGTPDIFRRIFYLYRSAIQISDQNDRNVETLRNYLVYIANNDENNRDLYNQQIVSELRMYPYSNNILALADQVYRLAQLNAIPIKPAEPYQLRDVSTMAERISQTKFSHGRLVDIYRYAYQNSEETQVFSFDFKLTGQMLDMGSYIIQESLVRFLDLAPSKAGDLIRSPINYNDAKLKYEKVRKYLIRNKLATSAITALNIWIDSNPTLAIKYKHKKIQYTYDMNFLGGSENFLGKAFEYLLDIQEKPAYNLYDPGSPHYNPESPVFISPTDHNIILTSRIKDWVEETAQNMKSAIKYLEDRHLHIDKVRFTKVIYSYFFSLLELGNDRTIVLNMLSESFENNYQTIILLDQNIVDLVVMFETPLEQSFATMQNQGRDLLDRDVSIEFFNETVSLLSQYLASITYAPVEYMTELAFHIMLNKPQDQISQPFDRITRNRVNFWNGAMKSLENPTNIYTLTAQILRTIRFSERPRSFANFIDNYPGNKYEALKMLLTTKDYTVSYVADYIIDSDLPQQLKDLARNVLANPFKHDLTDIKTVDDVKIAMTKWGLFHPDEKRKFIKANEKYLSRFASIL